MSYLRPLTPIKNWNSEYFRYRTDQFSGHLENKLGREHEDIARAREDAVKLARCVTTSLPDSGKVRFQCMEWSILEMHSIQLLSETMAWQLLNEIDAGLTKTTSPRTPWDEWACRNIGRDTRTKKILDYWLDRVPVKIAYKQTRWERGEFILRLREHRITRKDIGQRMRLSACRIGQLEWEALRARKHPSPVERYFLETNKWYS